MTTALAPLTHGDPPNSSDSVHARKKQGLIHSFVHQSLVTVRHGLLQVGLDGSQPLAARILGSCHLAAIPISMTKSYTPFTTFEGEMWKPPTVDKTGKQLSPTHQKAANLWVHVKRAQHEAKIKRQRLPAVWQTLGLAAGFFSAGYISDSKGGGDPINAAGIATSWSCLYLLLFGLRVTRPATFALTAATAVLGTATYGSYYYGEANWRDALPGLSRRIEGKPGSGGMGAIRLHQ